MLSPWRSPRLTQRMLISLISMDRLEGLERAERPQTWSHAKRKSKEPSSQIRPRNPRKPARWLLCWRPWKTSTVPCLRQSKVKIIPVRAHWQAHNVYNQNLLHFNKWKNLCKVHMQNTMLALWSCQGPCTCRAKANKANRVNKTNRVMDIKEHRPHKWPHGPHRWPDHPDRSDHPDHGCMVCIPHIPWRPFSRSWSKVAKVSKVSKSRSRSQQSLIQVWTPRLEELSFGFIGNSMKLIKYENRAGNSGIIKNHFLFPFKWFQRRQVVTSLLNCKNTLNITWISTKHAISGQKTSYVACISMPCLRCRRASESFREPEATPMPELFAAEETSQRCLQVRCRCDAQCAADDERVFASSPRSEGCKDSQDLLIPLISSQILKSHRCQEKHIQSENNWERVSLLRILRRSSSLDQHGRRHRRCFSGEESQNWMLHLYAKMKISRSSASISIIFLHCTFLHTVEQICTFTSVRSVQMRVTWVRLKYYTAYRNSFNENLLRPSLQRHVSSTLSHCQSCFAHSWHVQAETGGAGIFAVATVEVPLCHYAFIQCLEVVILLRLQEALHIIASFLRENVAAV